LLCSASSLGTNGYEAPLWMGQAKAQPLVTVLIDTYNYGRFIQEAIDSVLAQDFPAEEMEILVVDDGSVDDTAERVKKYGDRVQYFWKPNGGQASAFNFGLRRARGEIVAFLDADDYWLPGKLRRIVDAFEQHPKAGMVYHTLLQYDAHTGTFKDGGLALLSGFLPANAKELLSYVLYPTSFLAFRRKVLEELLPIPEELTIQADAHLSALVIFLAPIVGVPKCLAVYRVHGQNLFADRVTVDRTRHQKRMETRKALVAGMKKWLCEHAYDLRRTDLRMLFKQWELLQEKDEFLAEPPGRMKISRHLMQYAHFYGPQLTWRHRTVTYMNAAGALVVGYKNVHKLDEWRIAIKSAFRGASSQNQRGPEGGSKLPHPIG
jgi:glycosyltransferase involved in cell wall biosynthesis